VDVKAAHYAEIVKPEVLIVLRLIALVEVPVYVTDYLPKYMV
jgi:hypothetical protein